MPCSTVGVAKPDYTTLYLHAIFGCLIKSMRMQLIPDPLLFLLLLEKKASTRLTSQVHSHSPATEVAVVRQCLHKTSKIITYLWLKVFKGCWQELM